MASEQNRHREAPLKSQLLINLHFIVQKNCRNKNFVVYSFGLILNMKSFVISSSLEAFPSWLSDIRQLGCFFPHFFEITWATALPQLPQVPQPPSFRWRAFAPKLAFPASCHNPFICLLVGLNSLASEAALVAHWVVWRGSPRGHAIGGGWDAGG